MNEDILEIFSDLLKKDRQALLDDFNCDGIWDSFKRVEVMFALEEELGIQFPREAIKELTTPQKMYDAACALMEEA